MSKRPKKKTQQNRSNDSQWNKKIRCRTVVGRVLEQDGYCRDEDATRVQRPTVVRRVGGPVIVIAIVDVGVVGCGACPGTVVRLEVVASLTTDAAVVVDRPKRKKIYSTPRFIKVREQTFLQGSKNESSNIQIIHLFP